MKKRVVALALGPSVKHTWLPACHPFDVVDAGTKNERLVPAKQMPGIQVAIGVETEIEVKDERHEKMLRSSHRLKFLDDEPKAEAAPKKTDAPKPEDGNSAPKDEVQSEAPAAKGKAKK